FVRARLADHDLALDRPYLDVVGRVLGEAQVARVAADEPEHLLATLGDVLLTPTRIYALDALALRDALAAAGAARAWPPRLGRYRRSSRSSMPWPGSMGRRHERR